MKHYNPSAHQFAAKVFWGHDLTVWDAICYAVDEWYLGTTLQKHTAWDNLWESFIQKTKDSQYSPFLIQELREFFMHVIRPKYDDLIKPYVTEQINTNIAQGIWPHFGQEEVMGSYEEHRTDLALEMLADVKTLLNTEIDWLPKKPGGGDDDDDYDLDPENDPVNVAKRILNI